MSKLRILLAEDHETVREGLRLIVDAEADMEVVGEAADGRAALAQAQIGKPDVVVMDVSMPHMNGLKATTALRERCPNVKVLTLTRHAESGYLRELLRAGSSGYVLKQSRSSELLHAIRVVAAGGNYLDPAVAGEVVRDYGRGRASRSSAQTTETLSTRESQVLRFVASGHTNKEIAARLELSVKTVETHKSNAMGKLALRNRIDVVRFAALQGWLDEIE